MPVIISFRSRVIRALLTDSTIINLLLGLVGLLLSIGFLSVDEYRLSSHNYKLMFDFVNAHVWAALFFIYSISKLHRCLYRTPKYMKVAASTLGLWLWSYIVLSFIVFDPQLVAPSELMLIAPIVCEVWSLTLSLYTSKLILCRRSNDATI